MRVAVTGGAGFLGAHLARTLAERGAEVTCLDVVPSSPLTDGWDGVRLVRCDVGDWAELGDALRAAAPEVLFHTAGILSAAAEERPQAAYRANAVGTFNALELARLLGVGRVILTSTIATYGNGVAALVDESTQQRPTTIYGVSKVFSELLGEYYAGRFGVDFRALRLPSVVGAGRGGGGASAYSSLVVSEPARGRPYPVPVSPETVIPIAYVKDAVEAVIRLADADAAALTHRTYGMGGLSPTAAELAAAVRSAVPEAIVEFAPDAGLTTIVRTWPRELSGAAAERDWGWRLRFALPELVADFVAEERERAGLPPLIRSEST